MAEPEPPEAISARKLVIETAKFNVVTAYSAAEALDLLEQFPKLSACIVHSDIRDLTCATLVKKVKNLRPEMPVIVLSTNAGRRCKGADYHVPSQSPEQLLELLRERFGDPRRKVA
jgi:DNA-binding NtrC family response regulator